MAVPNTGVSQRLMNWARAKSPWITVYNSGACNACDIEIIACLMPRFDVERFGILVKGSPRHADILIVTGHVTLKQASRLRRVWEQMPEPKYVIAMGACAISGGPFAGHPDGSDPAVRSAGRRTVPAGQDHPIRFLRLRHAP